MNINSLRENTWIKNFYVEKNKQIAISIYGDRLDENRKVIGTNIWFDYYWRIHMSKTKGS